MTLTVVNAAATALVLTALMVAARRPMHHTQEGRAVLALLCSLALLSLVGLARRTGTVHADTAALAGWTVVAAVAVWVITRRT